MSAPPARPERPVEDGDPVMGARLHAALPAAGAPEGVRIVARRMPVGLQFRRCGGAVGARVAGPMSMAALPRPTPPDILAGAAAYAAAPDGIVPWRERPVIFRKQSLARIPPLES